jgi:predicted MFS family arabinose efflux permease
MVSFDNIILKNNYKQVDKGKHLRPNSTKKDAFCEKAVLLYKINTSPMLTTFFKAYINAFTGLPTAIWLLSLVSLVNRIGAMLIAFLTIYLTQHLHFSLYEAGTIAAFYGVGSIAGANIGGYLTDRFGYFRVQWITVLANGIVLLWVMTVREYYALCVAMVILSIAAESFRPANAVALRSHSTLEQRTRAYSLMRVSVNLAIAVGVTLGGFIIQFGWHWLFIVDSVTCFMAVGILLLFVPNKIASDAPPQTRTEARAAYKAERSAYTDLPFLFFIVLTFCGAVVFMQIVWTVPLFFAQDYHWTTVEIGIASAVNAVLVMTVEMPLIFRIERKLPHLRFVQLGFVLYGAAYLCFLVPLLAGWGAAIWYMILVSFGEIFVMPFSTTWITTRSGIARQGQYMGLYGMAYSLCNVVSPKLGTQFAADYGFSTLWVLLLALSGFAIAGCWALYYYESKTAHRHPL